MLLLLDNTSNAGCFTSDLLRPDHVDYSKPGVLAKEVTTRTGRLHCLVCSPPQTISRTADSNSSQPIINTHPHSISNINSHTGTKKNTGPRIKLQTIPRSAVQPLSAEPRPAFGASIKKVVSNKSNPEIDKHSIDSSKPKPAEPQPYISSIKVPPPAIPEPVVDSKTLDPVLSDSLEDEYGIDMYMDEALQSPMADFIMDDQLASHEDPHIASNADTVKSTDWEEVEEIIKARVMRALQQKIELQMGKGSDVARVAAISTSSNGESMKTMSEPIPYTNVEQAEVSVMFLIPDYYIQDCNTSLVFELYGKILIYGKEPLMSRFGSAFVPDIEIVSGASHFITSKSSRTKRESLKYSETSSETYPSFDHIDKVFISLGLKSTSSKLRGLAQQMQKSFKSLLIAKSSSGYHVGSSELISQINIAIAAIANTVQTITRHIACIVSDISSFDPKLLVQIRQIDMSIQVLSAACVVDRTMLLIENLTPAQTPCVERIADHSWSAQVLYDPITLQLISLLLQYLPPPFTRGIWPFLAEVGYAVPFGINETRNLIASYGVSLVWQVIVELRHRLCLNIHPENVSTVCDSSNGSPLPTPFRITIDTMCICISVPIKSDIYHKITMNNTHNPIKVIPLLSVSFDPKLFGRHTQESLSHERFPDHRFNLLAK
ncbi:hypothetical protein BSLG_005735 [Batrachochytrium salamandrivorans]|nr:hypothetical protein BSLG_005735 [Batrachochytrium salamandrivorans]